MLSQPQSSSRSLVRVGCVGLAIVLGSPSPAGAATLISGSEATFGGHTYGLLTTDTWSASEAAAVSLGGHLVTVNDILENNFVFDTYANFGSVNRTLWIGLSYQGPGTDSTTSWAWSSGASEPYRNWWSSDPNGYSAEPAVAMVPLTQSSTAKQWFDAQDAMLSYFSTNVHGVVEFSAVPEPAETGAIAGVLALALVWMRRRGDRGSAIKS